MALTLNKRKSKESAAKRKKMTRSERSFLSTLIIKYGLLIVAVALFVMFAFLEPRFITPRNIFKIIGQGSVIGLMALGLTIIVVAGEFDISFAAVATLCCVLSVFLIGALGVNIFLAWGICIALSIGISLVNAVNIVKIGVPSFVATLGMMGLLEGISLWITGGGVIYYAIMPDGFKSIGRGMIGNLVPSPVISFSLGAIVLIIFLDFTYIGRYFYAVGGSSPAARHAGVNVNKAKFLAFFIMGIIAGLSGIIMASMFGGGNPIMGGGYLFPAVIATFLGAIFLKEGLPNTLGTVVAAMLLAIIANGLVMVGLPLYIKEMVQGIILAVSVAIVCMLKPGGIPGVKMG